METGSTGPRAERPAEDSAAQAGRDEDPSPSSPGAAPRQPDDDAGDSGGWSLGRFVRSAFGAPPEEEDPGTVENALGAAFEGSTDVERGMVANILRLRDLRVLDVMVPRADIIAVSEDADLPTVMAAFNQGSFSRMPVYRETLDDPIGFVHLKDLAIAYGVGSPVSEEIPAFDLKRHMRTALFVPPSMQIAALMQKMQGARVHMALVIDEFGGVDGLVTIEDLVEQIVGDIEDEHDEDEGSLWREEAPGVWIVSARADIAEFEEAAGVTLRPADWEDDVDTLGGLVFTMTGRVPVRAEVIAHPDGHEFQVIDADPRRIKRLRLTRAGAGPLVNAASRRAAE